MAHKTLIGGTAYEISGGKTLVGGTAYGVTGGKTLAGGTGYNLSFGPTEPKPHAMLYSDGSLIFQLGKEVDSSHGSLVASYGGIEDTGNSYPPWRNNLYGISRVEFKDVIRPKSLYRWFENGRNITDWNLANLDTSDVTTMNSTFNYCTSLTSLDLSGWNTRSVTSMNSMFYECSSLTSLDLSGFDTSSVTDMANMFSGCESLTSLDLSGWNTRSVRYMGSMFKECSSLTSLDISDFDTSSVMDMYNMFSDCANLRTIYVSRLWSTSKLSFSMTMFYGCTSLSGAMSYDSACVDATYANYTTGYLTLKT